MFLLLSIAVSAVGAEKDKIIYVADLQDFSGGVSHEVLDLFTEIVRDGARKYATGYSLMDKENAQIILEGFGLDLKECLAAGREDCEVKFAERVQADVGVSGQILKLPEGGMRVVLKMHDVTKRSPINSTIKGANSINELEHVLTESVVELFAPLYRPVPSGRGVIGGGRVTGGISIDGGEKIVNKPSDKTGLVFIETTPPGADIQINGKSVGTAPYQASMMIGRYVVIAKSNAYYHPARHEFELTSDGASIELELPAAFGGIEITSTPSDSDVLIDDKPVGKTPYRDNRVLSGKHKVEVRRNLYKPVRGTVTVIDGRMATRDFELEKNYGAIKVTSDPPGADITLDGKKIGKSTPALIKFVKTGEHIVNLELPGYGRVGDTVVSVTSGGVVDLHKDLVPKNGTLVVMTQYRDNSKPCRGTVTLDGKNVGQSPWKGQVLAEVRHHVTAACGGRPSSMDVVVEHNDSKTITVDVVNPDLHAAVREPRRDSVSKPSREKSSGTEPDALRAKMDKRRKRASFQARFSGGLDLNRAKNGVGGLIQIGLGTGRWFDIHTGVGFPSYAWVTDFEVNLYPYGRFVPTLALRVNLGFHPDHNVYGFDVTAGVEMWMASWAAFFVKVGVGYSDNRTHNTSGVYVPGWIGLEFRY